MIDTTIEKAPGACDTEGFDTDTNKAYFSTIPTPGKAIVLTPDKAAAQRYLTLLDQRTDECTYQTFYDIKTLAALIGQGISTAWRNTQNDPDFPRPIRMNAGCTRFNVGAIPAYLLKKANTSARPVRKQRLKGQVAIRKSLSTSRLPPPNAPLFLKAATSAPSFKSSASATNPPSTLATPRSSASAWWCR